MPIETLTVVILGILVVETAGMARLHSDFAQNVGLWQSLRNANSVTAIAVKIVGYGSSLLLMFLVWNERESAWPVPAIGMMAVFCASIWHYRASNRTSQ